MFRPCTAILLYLMMACNSSTDNNSVSKEQKSNRNQDTTLDYKNYIRNIDSINLPDIISDWQWLLHKKFAPVIVTNTGDLFLKDKFESVYFLETGIGKLQKVAADSLEFDQTLMQRDSIEKWFLPSIIEKLVSRGLTLKTDEVYSYKLLPGLNGTYSPDNFEVTNISVHFSITGQICQQIQKVPDGTKIEKIIVKPTDNSN
jgi:hypothetical protein